MKRDSEKSSEVIRLLKLAADFEEFLRIRDYKEFNADTFRYDFFGRRQDKVKIKDLPALYRKVKSIIKCAKDIAN